MPRTNSMQTILRVVVRELRDTQQQVKKLERRNRWLSLGILVCLLAILLFVVVVLSPSKMITANQYAVADEKGQDRIIVGTSAITFLDQAMKQRIRLGLDLDGSPELTFYDVQQKCRGTLGLDANGHLTISLFDEQGNPRESFGIDSHRAWENTGSVPVSDATP